MTNGNEWNGLSELLSDLIAKYADTLDIDSVPDPKSDSIDTKTNEIDHTIFDKCIDTNDVA